MNEVTAKSLCTNEVYRSIELQKVNKSLSKENNELRDYVKTAQQFLGGMRLDSPVHDNRIQQ